MSQITDLVEAIEADIEERVIRRVLKQLAAGIITANAEGQLPATPIAPAAPRGRHFKGVKQRRRGPHGPIAANEVEIEKVREMLRDFGSAMTPKQIHKADSRIGARRAFAACAYLEKEGLVEKTKDGYQMRREQTSNGPDSYPAEPGNGD